MAKGEPALHSGASVAVPDSVAIRPLDAAARFSLRVRHDPSTGLPAAGGLVLDVPILRSAAAGERLAARLGPDEWLLIGREDDARALSAEVEAALAGRLFSLVEIGDRNEAFAVSGRGAASVLNAGCPLDLADAAFPAGAATRTLLGKAEIVLVRTGPSEYRVECWRSFADYICAFLRDAASC